MRLTALATADRVYVCVSASTKCRHRGASVTSLVPDPVRVWNAGPMHVVVAGCGRTGAGLATSLESQGHTVAIIDRNPKAFRRLPPGFSGAKLNGYAFDRETLLLAGIDRAGGFAAVTSGDNSNIVSARIARETFQVASVVARIYDPRRAVIYQKLGIATVATVSWTTDQVLRRMFPESRANWTDQSGSMSLIERTVPDQWVGRPLSELDVAGEVRVVALTRAGSSRFVDAKTVGQEGDVVHFLVTAAGAATFDARLATPGVKL